MSIERVIGIDFGTSTSVIRVKRYADGEPVGDRLYTEEVKFNNIGLVPTVIQHIREGVPYYGYDAQKKHKNSTVYENFKVDLESEDMEVRAQARALTEEYFTYLAKQYRDQGTRGFLGEAEDAEKTLVSYPVKWSDETRRFMIEAAKKAGFPNVEGMDEAQAAIGAVMVQNTDYLEKKGYLQAGKAVNILMADMGAGTTDLVLCRYTPGVNAKNEVLSTWPKGDSTFFGGREMEKLLMEYLYGKLPETDADAVMRRCGVEKFKSWKEDYVSPALKRGEAVTEFSDLDMITELLEIDVEEYVLDRTELERLAANYLRGFSRLVNGCLRDAGMQGNEVDLVLLTGGHSQWYFVAEQLTGRLRQCGEIELGKIQKDSGRIIPVPRPQETVALGLVYSPLAGQIKYAAKWESMPKPTPASVSIPKSAQTSKEQVPQAASRDVPGNLNYTPDSEFELGIIEGNYYIRKYIGKRKSVNIPPIIRGHKVAAIGEYAFGERIRMSLKETPIPRVRFVTIPETVKTIGKGAFQDCRDLVYVKAHPYIEIIGEMAFCNCHNLQILDFGVGIDRPKMVKFPPELKEIGGSAFYDDRHFSGCILREVTLSKNTIVLNREGETTFHPRYCTSVYYSN